MVTNNSENGMLGNIVFYCNLDTKLSVRHKIVTDKVFVFVIPLTTVLKWITILTLSARSAVLKACEWICHTSYGRNVGGADQQNGTCIYIVTDAVFKHGSIFHSFKAGHCVSNASFK